MVQEWWRHICIPSSVSKVSVIGRGSCTLVLNVITPTPQPLSLLPLRPPHLPPTTSINPTLSLSLSLSLSLYTASLKLYTRLCPAIIFDWLKIRHLTILSEIFPVIETHTHTYTPTHTHTHTHTATCTHLYTHSRHAHKEETSLVGSKSTTACRMMQSIMIVFTGLFKWSAMLFYAHTLLNTTLCMIPLPTRQFPPYTC